VINLGDSISGNISFNGLQTCGELIGSGACKVEQNSTIFCGNSGPTPNLTGVASNSLFFVWNLQVGPSPALQTLSFPNLTGGVLLQLTELPLLTEFEFGASLTLTYVTLNGTGLKSFSLPADTSKPGYEPIIFVIMNNKEMSQIHLGLKRSITAAGLGEFTISDNAPGAIIDLPNLISLNSSTSFGDFSNLNIPRLQVVNGSLNISNAQVFRFSGPSLQNVDGDFSLTGNFSEYVLISKLRAITTDGRSL
jgi:hypothetical protein